MKENHSIIVLTAKYKLFAKMLGGWQGKGGRIQGEYIFAIYIHLDLLK